MQKVLAKDEILSNVLDFIQARKYINSILSFDQNDCGKFFFLNKLNYINTEFLKDYEKWIEVCKKCNISTDDYTNFPYLNYWHYLLDYHLLNVRNDSYLDSTISFKQIYSDTLEKYGQTNWRTYIAQVWAKEYPKTYTLWMSW